MLAALLLAAALSGAAPPVPAAPPRCQEDDPCWVWSTMGDRSRGISTLDGARNLVVGPCRFARLYRYIDWSRTPQLRGDATARNGSCRTYRPIAPESVF